MEFTGERFIPDCGLEAEIELEHLQRYLSVQDIVAGKRVLDVASGAGYGTALLAERADYAFGIDIDLEAVTFARSRYNAANLEYCQSTLAALPFPDDSFDAVVSFETIEHVAEEVQYKFLSEIKRVLKKGGMLIVSSPDKLIYSDQPGYRNEYHVKEFYRNEFHDFLAGFFTNIKFFDQFPVLSYILAGSGCSSLKIINSEDKHPRGKYIIALCCDGEIPEDQSINTIGIDKDDKHQAKINRVVELQNEIVEKNQIITGLEVWVKKCRDTISDRDETIRTILEELSGERKERLVLQQSISEIRNLLDDERRKVKELNYQLNHLRSTKAWKIIQRAYQLKNKIWPL